MSKKNLDCLKLINYIENSLECRKLFNPRTKLLIAYSGGQDSTALLLIFYILSKKWHFKLAAVYCNHGWLNNNQANLTVFKMLTDYNIPFYYIDILSSGFPKSETQARNWRYTAFEEIRKKGQYDFVLTGHTLTDKVETVLFNLIRGTGLKGINSLKTDQIFTSSNLLKANKTKNNYFQHQTLTFFDLLSNLSCYFSCSSNFNSNCINNIKKIPDFLCYCYTKKKVNLIQKIFSNANFVSLITFIHPTTYFLTKRALINNSFVYLNSNHLIKKTNIKTCYLRTQPFCFYIDQTFYKFNFFPWQATKLLKRKINEKIIFFNRQLLIVIKTFKIKKSKSIFATKALGKKKLITFTLALTVPLPSPSPCLNRHGKGGQRGMVPPGGRSDGRGGTVGAKEKTLLSISSRKANFYFVLPLEGGCFGVPFFFHSKKGKLKIFVFNAFFNKKEKKAKLIFKQRNKQKLIIVRPLLKIQRLTITRFVQTLNILIYLDRSNYDVILTRNYMRYKIFPLLKYINPKCEQNIYKFSQISSIFFNPANQKKMTSTFLNYFID